MNVVRDGPVVALPSQHHTQHSLHHYRACPVFRSSLQTLTFIIILLTRCYSGHQNSKQSDTDTKIGVKETFMSVSVYLVCLRQAVLPLDRVANLQNINIQDQRGLRSTGLSHVLDLGLT